MLDTHVNGISLCAKRPLRLKPALMPCPNAAPSTSLRAGLEGLLFHSGASGVLSGWEFSLEITAGGSSKWGSYFFSGKRGIGTGPRTGPDGWLL